ncbi:MAG: hypothetical protein ACRENK_05975 [Gemmatimonadaceae bacterium]
MFRASLEGLQAAVKVFIIDGARSAIADEMLGPVRVVPERDSARESAIAFLRQEIPSATRAGILADIKRKGLEKWAVEFHMPFGMGVRNRLREVGYTEAVFGVTTLDDIWSDLISEAVRE